MEQIEGSRVLFREGQVILRRCAKCKELKPLEDFYDNPKMNGGKNSYCKTCANIRTRQWFKANSCPGLRCLQKKAQDAIRWAIHTGKIIKPSFCSQCLMPNGALDAHHDDYSKPLEVRWLCKSCHQKHHKSNGLH